MQALLDLDISANDRVEVLRTLVMEGYSTGSLEERLNGGAEMWVFGKDVKNKEVLK